MEVGKGFRFNIQQYSLDGTHIRHQFINEIFAMCIRCIYVINITDIVWKLNKWLTLQHPLALRIHMVLEHKGPSERRPTIPLM